MTIKIIKLIRSLYFNLRYLPLSKAIKIPIWIATPLSEVKLKKGQIILPDKISTAQIIIGGG